MTVGSVHRTQLSAEMLSHQQREEVVSGPYSFLEETSLMFRSGRPFHPENGMIKYSGVGGRTHVPHSYVGTQL